MKDRSETITDKESIMAILESCLGNQIYFDTTDERGNLVRLRLEAISHKNPEGFARLFQRKHLILSMFILADPDCSPILKVNQQYTISFQHDNETYSYLGKLQKPGLGAPRSRFLVPYSMFKHKRRRFPRTSLGGLAGIRAEILESVFDVANLSFEGVGIIVSNPDQFHLGQEVALKLIMDDCVSTGQARVQHITPISKGGSVCGMHLKFQEGADKIRMQKLVHLQLKYSRSAKSGYEPKPAQKP